MTSPVGLPIVAPTEPTTILEAQLAETEAWVAIKGYAIDGLRMAIALEMTAIDVERQMPNETLPARLAVREERLAQLRRHQQRIEGWNPLDPNQIPRKRP